MQRGPEETTERVLQFIRAHRLCRPGQRVLLACSGGADSAALLEILWRLAAGLRVSLGVLMVDHRQCPAFRLAVRLLQMRCRRRRLPFFLATLEDAVSGLSETELRRRRYRLLVDVARREGYHLLATGHTRDDQAETVLLRILRGTGVEGLAGMRPRRGMFIRPLLACSHSELQEYLRRLRLRWWEDPANRSLRVPRNRVRHRLLPMLKREFNPQIEEALGRLALSAGRMHELVRWAVRQVRPERVVGRYEVPREKLLALPIAARALVIKRMAERLHPERAGVEQERLEEALRALADGRARFRAMLGGGRQCYGRGDRIVVAKVGERPGFFRYICKGPGQIDISEADCRLRLSLRRRPRRLVPGPTRVYFDGRLVEFPLQVRSPLPGDRLQPWGHVGSHKISRLLMEAKIPREDRWRVPLLVSGDQILWLAGLRRSRLAPVTAETRQVLVAELLPKTSS